MLYLAFIFHMHQPYYVNLLTKEAQMPWVRLHGIKDYLDMVQILEEFPAIRQTFNLVPSLIEQIEDYANRRVKDKFFELSYKPAADLTENEKKFLLESFFSINKEKVISFLPRYYELFLKKEAKKEFNTQDYLDLQVWFNLGWTDPSFRQSNPPLKALVEKARFYREEEKQIVLDQQLKILEEIVPAYKKFAQSGQIEITFSPFYHPILPLLYSSRLAKEANPQSKLPKVNFAYPEDVRAQIENAGKFFQQRFVQAPQGMWPSEESVCEHILPDIIKSGIKWIVTDEAILFKSLKKKKRDTRILYRPYLLKREEGEVSVIFRDRNLSDILSFVYHSWPAEVAVMDFMKHLENISAVFKNEDALVSVAMDGENAWEFYRNDGHNFLNLLYQRLSDSKFLKTTTIKDYLNNHPAKDEIKRLAAGSWIFGNFDKWIGSPYKVRAWEYLQKAREELAKSLTRGENIPELAWKQIYIAEGSDWFWWYGDDSGNFDALFRMHLRNFYTLIGKTAPEYLEKPLEPVF